MTELIERVSVHLGDSDNEEECPFCPGVDTKHDWKTIEGAKNDSGTLRKAMVDPSRCSYSQQKGAKPKDGNFPNQNKDSAKLNPSPIYRHSVYGDYGNQAHHCISGNEIMSGHAIESILVNEGGEFLGQTGYNINNAANGVYLPSYPENYSGTDDEKYEIVKHAMEARKGQVHIGGHSGHDNAAGQDYPLAIGEELTALKIRILYKKEECPFCVESDGSPKKPFIPPYKVNYWLDKLSSRIKRKLTGDPYKWPYFISKYAKRYYIEITSDLPDSIDELL